MKESYKHNSRIISNKSIKCSRTTVIFKLLDEHIISFSICIPCINWHIAELSHWQFVSPAFKSHISILAHYQFVFLAFNCHIVELSHWQIASLHSISTSAYYLIRTLENYHIRTKKGRPSPSNIFKCIHTF